MKDEAERVVRGAATHLFGGLAVKGLLLLLIPFYARALTQEQYGLLGAMESLSGILMPLFGLGQIGTIVYFYRRYQDDSEGFRRHLGAVQALLLICGVVVATAALVFWPQVTAPFDTGGVLTRFPYGLVVVAAAFLFQPIGILWVVNLARERHGRAVLLEGSHSLLIAVLTVVLILGLGMGALGRFVSIVSVRMLMFAMCIVLLFRHFSLRFDRRNVKDALRLGLPLVTYSLGLLILTGSDKLLLMRYTPMAQVGLYTFAYSLAFTVNVLSDAFFRALAPVLTDLAKNSDTPEQDIGKIASQLVVVLVLAVTVFVWFSPEVILAAGGYRYFAAVSIFVPVCTGYVLATLYKCSSQVIMSKGKSWAVAASTIPAAIVNVILNVILIPRYGAVGAAVTSSMAFGVQFVIGYFLAKRCLAVKYDLRRIGLALAAFTSAAVFVSLVPLVSFRWFACKVLVMAVFAAISVRAGLLPRNIVRLVLSSMRKGPHSRGTSLEPEPPQEIP